MDEHTHLIADDQAEGSLEAGHSPAAIAVSAAPAARAGAQATVDIAWLSTRSEHWPRPPNSGEPLHGVSNLLFGVGTGGAGWLARLAHSSWFAGLEPQAEDLAISGGAPCGRWAMPDARGARTDTDDDAQAEAFLASEPLPSAWHAAVAVPHGAGLAEQAAALGLVGALRTRRDPGGRALGVVVTVDASPCAATDAYVRSLLDKGAFVVRPGVGAAGDHLHHLPVRTLTYPREGHLICVDFADYMYIWRPGRVADLHVIPFARGDAGHALRGVPLPAERSVRALSIGFHLDPDAPGQGLVEIDRFATVCRELLLAPDGDVVFTDLERLDGVTGSVDLLLIHEGTETGG
jgi:hypothetical protein